MKTPVEIMKTPMEIMKTPVEIMKTPVEIMKTPMEITKTPVENLLMKGSYQHIKRNLHEVYPLHSGTNLHMSHVAPV